MAILPAVGDPPPPAAVQQAAVAVRAGEVIVVPTDTVYGVAADPAQPAAIERLFALKRRPRDVPLPVLVADVDQALEVVDASEGSPALRLMERFWPGPLTVVVPRRAGVHLDLGSAGDTVGVRCPDHPLVRAVAAAGGPLATTSANLHGLATPPTAAGVVEQLELDAEVLVLDGGPCDGTPSTVVAVSGDEVEVIRHGAVPVSELRQALG